MSGERQTGVQIGPGYSTPATTQNAAAPSVSSQFFNRAVPTFRGDPGLAEIGATLGSFFKVGESLSKTAADIKYREDMRTLARESDDRTHRATADALAGKQADPEAGQYQDYSDAFAKTSAYLGAEQAVNDFQAFIKDRPRDGSYTDQDFARDRESFLKKGYGQGAGNPLYDETFLGAFHRGTEQVGSQFRAEVSATAERNGLANFQNFATSILKSPKDITDDKMDSFDSLALGLTHGDRQAADKLISATFTAAIQNPDQADAVVSAITRSKLGQRNPALLDEVSEKAAARIQSVNSLEAAKAWSGVHDSALALMADPTATPDQLLDLSGRAVDVFKRLGGKSQLDSVMGNIATRMAYLSKHQAEVNKMIVSYTTGAPIQSFMAGDGKSPSEYSDKYFEGFVGWLAQNGGDATQNLAATSVNGRIQPLLNDMTAAEFAKLVTGSGFRQASNGLISQQYKSELSYALMDPTDPAKQARAVRMYSQIENVVGADLIGRYMEPGAESLYRAASRYGGANVEDLFRTMKESPDVRKALTDKELNWSVLTGKADEKSSTIAANITKGLTDGLRKSLDRDGWFSGNTGAVPNGEFLSSMQAEVASQLIHQRGFGRKPDLDEAVANAVKVYSDRTYALPGQGKALMFYEDRWNGRGRSWKDPIATIDGKAAFAPFKIMNVKGEVEDPIETFRKLDLKEAQRKLGGIFGDPDKISFIPPTSQANDGVFLLARTDGTGGPITVGPGSRLVVPTFQTRVAGRFQAPTESQTGQEEIVVPDDPVAAEKLLKERMPKGFHLVDMGTIGGQRAWQLGYTFRLIDGPEERERILAAGKYKAPGFWEQMWSRGKDAAKTPLPWSGFGPIN